MIDNSKELINIIEIGEAENKGHLDENKRESVEETRIRRSTPKPSSSVKLDDTKARR